MNSASSASTSRCERLVELGPVEQQKAVLRRQNRRPGFERQVGDERVHRLARIRREGRDVDERPHVGIGARLGDHRSAVGVANENYGLALRIDDALGGVGVTCKRKRRILDDADAVTVLHQLAGKRPASRSRLRNRRERERLRESAARLSASRRRRSPPAALTGAVNDRPRSRVSGRLVSTAHQRLPEAYEQVIVEPNLVTYAP